MGYGWKGSGFSTNLTRQNPWSMCSRLKAESVCMIEGNLHSLFGEKNDCFSPEIIGPSPSLIFLIRSDRGHSSLRDWMCASGNPSTI